MCWSGEASFTLAGIGLTGAFCSARWGGLPPVVTRGLRSIVKIFKPSKVYAPIQTHGHDIFRWLPLVYFSIMETLQGLTYPVIDDCGNPLNRTLTYLSFLHIAFQPFFINMFAMSWLPKDALSKKTKTMVWGLCTFATGVFLMMLWHHPPFGQCNVDLQPLCGSSVCSYAGNWHIAWRLDLNALDSYYISYWITGFAVPFLYGSRRFATYHLLLGPLLARVLTSNKDERPAVWCLLSIGFLVATHIKPISRLMSNKEKRAEDAKQQ